MPDVPREVRAEFARQLDQYARDYAAELRRHLAEQDQRKQDERPPAGGGA